MVIKISTFYDEFDYNYWQIVYSNSQGRKILKEIYLEKNPNGNKQITLKAKIKTPKEEKEKIIREYRWPSTAKKGLLREVAKYLIRTNSRYNQPVQIGRTKLENPEQIKKFLGLEKKVTEPLPHSQSPSQEKLEQH